MRAEFKGYLHDRHQRGKEIGNRAHILPNKATYAVEAAAVKVLFAAWPKSKTYQPSCCPVSYNIHSPIIEQVQGELG